MLSFDSLSYLQSAIQSWPLVSIRPKRFGLHELSLLSLHEFARLNANGLIEICFPSDFGAQLIHEGKASPHPIYKDSRAWVSFAVYGRGDVHRGLALLRLAYLLKLAPLRASYPLETSLDDVELGQLLGKLDVSQGLRANLQQALSGHPV